MVIAADYPFMDILWTMLIFFAWVIWIWTVIVMLTDVFRRQDIGGGTKALWVIFMVVLPFVGVLTYLIVEHKGMGERNLAQAEAAKADTDQYIRSVAGGAAGEIEKGQELLASGAITQAEFDALKVRALAAELATGTSDTPPLERPRSPCHRRSSAVPRRPHGGES